MLTSRERVGPTAHYTSYVWARNGLSHPELETREGRLLFDSLQPAMLVSRAAGGPTLEAYLLARHRAIDALLERAIDAGRVSQVIEVAAGLSSTGSRSSPRGCWATCRPMLRSGCGAGWRGRSAAFRPVCTSPICTWAAP